MTFGHGLDDMRFSISISNFGAGHSVQVSVLGVQQFVTLTFDDPYSKLWDAVCKQIPASYPNGDQNP